MKHFIPMVGYYKTNPDPREFSKHICELMKDEGYNGYVAVPFNHPFVYENDDDDFSSFKYDLLPDMLQCIQQEVTFSSVMTFGEIKKLIVKKIFEPLEEFPNCSNDTKFLVVGYDTRHFRDNKVTKSKSTVEQNLRKYIDMLEKEEQNIHK